MAEGGDPVHEHADQLDDQDADEPEDEEQPDRLQLVVLVGQEEDLGSDSIIGSPLGGHLISRW